MSKSVGKKDVIWSYIGQIVNYGVHILLTPVISVKLSSGELGLWYTFTSIFTLVNFFDTGFSPLIMRNAAYCMGGAQVLQKEGIRSNQQEGEMPCNYGLLKTLYRTARKLYTAMALIFGVLLLSVGTPYIQYIARVDFKETYITAWGIYVCGIAVNVFMIFLPAYLKGLGSIASVQKIYAIGRGVQMLLSIGGVFGGLGLLALAGSFLTGNLIICFGSYLYYVSNWKRKIQSTDEQMTQREVLEILWFNARKLGLVAIGRYFTTQGNILICSAFLSLDISARYGLTIQALQTVSSVSMIYLQTAVPTISAAKIEKNVNKERKYFSMAMVIYWLLYIVMALAVYFIANPILELLHANTKLLEGRLMIFAAVIFFLQYNQISFSLYIGMGNKVPYMKGEFLSGVVSVLLSCFAVRYALLGVEGILVAQFIAQICYNDWKWPYEGCRQLGMSPGEVWRLGVSNVRQMLGLFMKKQNT